MRISIPLNSNSRIARLLVLALGVALCGLPMLTAQASAPTPAPTTSHRPLHPLTRPGAAHPLTSPAPAASAPAAPPAPEIPDWPVNDRAAQASVVWDSHGLRIDAKNSSLTQILQDFSAATGAQVDGMAADERVFGSYGPGQAGDVLSQLLQGSGYNVIMIGDRGQGAPRQIVLSVRQAGGAQPAASSNPAGSDDDADVDEPVQPPQIPTPPFRPGFPPGGPFRNPQQINMQEQQQREMQMRQQQMQQQLQQQPQPPNPPN
jgi:hypothetical protein